METPRVRLGELLVRAGLISGAQLEEALAEQQKNGRRLGSLLVELGLVSETQVTQILSQQLSVPWVSLHHIDFSRQLLNLVPIDIVERYCLIPIYVRRVRGLGDALYVAMDDPTNGRALDEVAARAGLHVRPMIAPPSDIRAAIRVYYGVGDVPESAPSALAGIDDAEHEDAPTGVHARATSSPDHAAPEPRSSSPQLDAEVDDLLARSSPSTLDGETRPSSPAVLEPPMESSITASSGAVEPPAAVPKAAAAPMRSRVSKAAPRERPPPSSPPSSNADAPPPSSRTESFSGGRPSGERAETSGKPRKKMISLTLLDGTTIAVPAKGKGKGKDAAEEPEGERAHTEHEDQLTARDLVAALRAAAHGADASEILGENVRWEAMFSALLSLLLKKHLIADWEFIEEFKKG